MNNIMQFDASLRYPNVKSARMIELDEMIAHGWGSVPQRLIPEDFRETLPHAIYLQGFEVNEAEDESPGRIENGREAGPRALRAIA
jgi:hypothetical protein